MPGGAYLAKTCVPAGETLRMQILFSRGKSEARAKKNSTTKISKSEGSTLIYSERLAVEVIRQ
jgi:hypothetical protein